MEHEQIIDASQKGLIRFLFLHPNGLPQQACKKAYTIVNRIDKKWSSVLKTVCSYYKLHTRNAQTFIMYRWQE
ncbi:hypothetical protein EG68_03014 [Paragonimus skrjabini miyazakii]|uniref:Uncharacterized protein n=1 Tax=Paragonimus skrjabini miyazakii TaxID=59628 RepID=A0A8S9YYS6_9TREM|nr:hypothetical protein EG68_03014 [Paragonimus skrjabini miyazakii]